MEYPARKPAATGENRRLSWAFGCQPAQYSKQLWPTPSNWIIIPRSWTVNSDD